MNGQAATASVEEFIRWANLPFSTAGKVLNNGATVHVDGAKYYGNEFTKNFEYHGFKIWVASKYLKLSHVRHRANAQDGASKGARIFTNRGASVAG